MPTHFAKSLAVLCSTLTLLVVSAFACASRSPEERDSNQQSTQQSSSSMNTITNELKAETGSADPTAAAQLDTATFGAGCFWCVEAVFQRLDGVEKVVSGYMGGAVKNPTYREVCTGETGHAEVCQIIYNPQKISFVELLEVFWQTHDPTTLNRQGADAGTQYRSAVFYHTAEQKKLAEEYKQKLNSAKIWTDPIVTEITVAAPFYKAEDYHQNYFNDNGYQPYCSVVIRPKVEKFEKVFKQKLKKQ